jgi:hypothetical protein
MIEKLRNNIVLYSFIGQIVLALLILFLSVTSLIVASNASVSVQIAYFYVALAFSFVDIILIAWQAALYFVGDDEEKVTKRRIHFTYGLRVAFRFSNLILGVSLILGEYVGGGVNGTSSSSWDGFIKIATILILVAEGVILLYSLWKAAWMRENPERYSYGIPNPEVPYEEKGKAHNVQKGNNPSKKPSNPTEVKQIEIPKKMIVPPSPLFIEQQKKKDKKD